MNDKHKTNNKRKLIGLVIVVILLISVSTIAFANRHKLSNSLAMIFKNPTKYFQHIEKDRVDNCAALPTQGKQPAY